MAKLSSFTFISLNGFYKGINDDIQWHQHGGEEAEYSVESLKKGNTLLFGRVTFEMMKSFWPTKMAHDSFPEVAKGMNDAEKIVVSSTLNSADWNNSRIIKDHLIENVVALKNEIKSDITILGSGTILKQLSEENLIDEYQIMIDPVFIEAGQPILNQLRKNIDLELIKSRVFKSGIVLLCYKKKND